MAYAWTGGILPGIYGAWTAHKMTVTASGWLCFLLGKQGFHEEKIIQNGIQRRAHRPKPFSDSWYEHWTSQKQVHLKASFLERVR